MGLTGRRWKRGNVWSRPVLMGRGLAHRSMLDARAHTNHFHPRGGARWSGRIAAGVHSANLSGLCGGHGGGVTPGFRSDPGR
jgi:hypothetical protein